jgi:biopolymer transport protein TolR
MKNIRGRDNNQRAFSEINMVPFIDVMLVMLIIFMVSAPMIPSSVIPLPSVGSALDRPVQPVEIEIFADETIQIRYNSQVYPSDLKNVAVDLVKIDPSVIAPGSAASPVLISAFKTLPYESVIHVMDELRKNSVTRIGLSVQTGK